LDSEVNFILVLQGYKTYTFQRPLLEKLSMQKYRVLLARHRNEYMQPIGYSLTEEVRFSQHGHTSRKNKQNNEYMQNLCYLVLNFYLTNS